MDLASHSIFPLFQFAIANKLSAAIAAMNKNDTHPKFDPQDDLGRNTQESGNFSNGEVEVAVGLDESV